MKAKDGKWIQKAVNPAHKGFCTPMTKSTCTPKRKALAKTFKKHHGFHEDGGLIPIGEDGIDITPGQTPFPAQNKTVDPWAVQPSPQSNQQPTPTLYTPPTQDSFTADNKPYYQIPKGNQNPTGQSAGNIAPINSKNLSKIEANFEKANKDSKSGLGSYGQYLPPSAASMIAPTLQAIDTLIPDRKPKPPVQRPQFNYNPYQYGTGSQAIMRCGGSLKRMDDGGEQQGPDVMKDATSAISTVTSLAALLKNGGYVKADDGKGIKNKDKARKVDTVPAGYNPLGEEGGNKYYGKDTPPAQLPMAKPGGNNDPKAYSAYLQKQLQSGISPDELVKKKYITSEEAPQYKQYYKPPVSDIVYLNSPQAPAQQQPQPPATAFRGNNMFMKQGVSNVAVGQALYPSRNSANPSQGGALNTAEQNVQFQYYKPNSSETDGQTINIPVDAWNKRGQASNFVDTSFVNKYRQKMVNGGTAPYYEEDGGITPISPSSQHSNPIMEFNGPSHEDGGIPISYAGKNVEVEGNETAFIDRDNDLNVMGNMVLPGTSKKFKDVGKIIAEKEVKNQKYIDKGTELVNNENPKDRWGMLKFNSGKAMLLGGRAKREELNSSKEWMANLQEHMLDHAKELGVDPQEYAKGKHLAKYGMSIADDGDDLKPITGSATARKKKEPVTFASKMQNPSALPDPRQLPNQDFAPQEDNKMEPFSYDPSPINKPDYTMPLSPLQFLPELYTAATNKVQPVYSQRFQPNLLQPYKVSFQDRLNENQASFNNLSKELMDNPQALSTISGQKYSADNQVKGEEFRTNQAISNDIINKNTELLNNANLENIKLADLQYTRQAEAKSTTKALNNKVLASVSDKILQNNLNNQRLKVYQNLTNYAYNPETGKYEYFGPKLDELINFEGSGTSNNQEADNRTITTYNPDGTVKQTRVTQPGALDVRGKTLTNTTKQFNLMKSFYSPKGIVPYTPPR